METCRGEQTFSIIFEKLCEKHFLKTFKNIFSKTRCEIRIWMIEKKNTRERNHVDGNLTKIAIELTRETQAASGAGKGSADEMVQITVSRGGQLERAEADVVEGFVVHHEGLVRVALGLNVGEKNHEK